MRYSYECKTCGFSGDRFARIEDRHDQLCELCGHQLTRLITAPAVRVKGRADGKVVGGPDQFTADVLGYKEKELPDNLRAYPRGEK